MTVKQKEVLDPERLLLKVNSGEALDAKILSEVAATIEDSLSDNPGRKASVDDVYSLLLVLGRADARAHLRTLERFLEQRDPYVVSLVLEILCLQWRTTAEYVERVIHFALGVSWDEDDDVRHTALKILGEYLHEGAGKPNVAAEVLALLLSTFSDSTLDRWTRQQAYFALCRAGGKDWSELPSECKILDLRDGSQDIDWPLIDSLSNK